MSENLAKIFDNIQCSKFSKESYSWIDFDPVLTDVFNFVFLKYTPDHVLADSDLELFHELKSTNQYIDDSVVLSKAIKEADLIKLPTDRSEYRPNIRATKEASIRSLEENVKRLTKVVESNDAELKQLTADEAASVTECKQQADICRRQELKFLASLETLQTVTAESTANDIESLPTLSLDDYILAERDYSDAVTEYSRRQFFEGMADLVEPAVGTKFGILDMVHPDVSLLKSMESDEWYQNLMSEIGRLRSAFTVGEQQHIRVLLDDARLSAANEYTGKLAEHIQTIFGAKSTLQLSEELRQTKSKLTECRRQLDLVVANDFNPTLAELTSLFPTPLLIGDYELKLKRQEYFLSKQRQIVRHLSAQRARSELVSQLYAVESDQQTQLNRAVAAAQMTLVALDEAHVRRMDAMERLKVLTSAPVVPRKTISTSDDFLNSCYEALEAATVFTAPHTAVSLAADLPRAELVVRPHSRLIDMARSLVRTAEERRREEEVAWQGALETRSMLETICDRISTASTFAARPPPLHNPAAVLAASIGAIERSLNAIADDIKAKQEQIASDPLLERERRLFVLFHTDPAELTRQLSSMGV